MFLMLIIPYKCPPPHQILLFSCPLKQPHTFISTPTLDFYITFIIIFLPLGLPLSLYLMINFYFTSLYLYNSHTIF